MRRKLLKWTDRIGDIGETEIKARLQRIATVSKIERDIGIDFFCELILNDQPLLPFYVQAKSSEHLNKRGGRAIEKGTILYWLNQLSPVFLIFHDHDHDICFWESIESNRYSLIQKLFSTDKKSIYISFSRNNILDKSDNPPFKQQLDSDYQSLIQFRGMPQFVGTGYEKRIPAPPRSEREYRLTKSNARACLYSLIHHHLIRGEHASAIDLCEAVAIFDRNHATHFKQLGYLYKSIGQKKKSIKNFEIAIDLMKKDKKWNRKDLSARIKSLEKEIDYVADPDDQNKQDSN